MFPPYDEIVAGIVKNKPEYSFVTEDKIGHDFWVVSDKNLIKKLPKEFSAITSTYDFADGHHLLLPLH